MVPTRYATRRVSLVIYREALLSSEQTSGNNTLPQDDSSGAWEEDADYELDISTDNMNAQCVDCASDDEGDDAVHYGACTCRTYEPTECYCEGRGECWWCNTEVEDTLLHSLNDDSLIDCLPDEIIDELNEVHANRWMETLYEPGTPSDTPDMVDMYMQLGFDPPA